MEIVFNRLYKIDVRNNAVTNLVQLQENINLKGYVEGLLEKIGNVNPDRTFEFSSETVEVVTLINKLLKNEEFEDSCERIASRLLLKEIDAQKSIDKLVNIEVQKGILIISLVKMTDTAKKLIFTKADYSEFIEETTGDKNTGLPIKKKIFKAFIAEINNSNEIIKTTTFDTNQTVSAYWWKEFLELKVVRTNEENTQKAFDVIESRILNPIKSKHKADYIPLWNSTVLYFRSKLEFNIDDYVDNGIGNYLPFDDSFNIDELKARIRELPEKYKFDNRFELINRLVNKRIKKSIALTGQIDLVLKQEIPDLANTIKPYIEGGNKYVMIKSDDGYEYFKKKIVNEQTD